jgi:phosphate transport system permease protein
MREAAYALGKTRIATIRSVLLPGVRSNIAASITLGTARIIGDTAIIVVLVDTLRVEAGTGGPVLSLLKGTGPTLTSYVYDNSPAGEGGAPQKAYAAAFVLMILVFALNVLVGRLGRSSAEETGMTVAGAVV